MRISVLTLFTSHSRQLFDFYKNKLGLHASWFDDYFEVVVGKTTLIFRRSSQSTPYHFAINIPSNQILDALLWLNEKTSVLKNGEDEIVDFKNWNAFSIYFYDPDKNIIELIARKNLDNYSTKKFSSSSLIEISEIGLAVDDVKTTYNELNNIGILPVYWGDMEKFCAAGDEHGLFIIVNKHTKTWFPSNDEACSSDFSMNGTFNITFKNGKVFSTEDTTGIII